MSDDTKWTRPVFEIKCLEEQKAKEHIPQHARRKEEGTPAGPERGVHPRQWAQPMSLPVSGLLRRILKACLKKTFKITFPFV